ncbi:hypothetical protein [Saccharopolyspora endophytica]|uniref:hypothetical protein n=1 Tax=Saccharopolyspora endophytica TaxID=543886 RepID=UPI001FE533C3|nr:hypothetical protein [Saccharopolyspora endophytica]
MPLGTALAGTLSARFGLMPAFALCTAAAAAMSLCPLLFPAWRALDRLPVAGARAS